MTCNLSTGEAETRCLNYTDKPCVKNKNGGSEYLVGEGSRQVGSRPLTQLGVSNCIMNICTSDGLCGFLFFFSLQMSQLGKS